MSKTPPPSVEQLDESIVAYHMFIEAFYGQLPFACVEMFQGSELSDESYRPFPYMRFRIDKTNPKAEDKVWFQKFLEIWNYKQVIEWEFRLLPPDSREEFDFFLLAPKDTNEARDPWFVINARHAAAQLGAFFNAWKYGLMHQKANLPKTT